MTTECFMRYLILAMVSAMLSACQVGRSYSSISYPDSVTKYKLANKETVKNAKKQSSALVAAAEPVKSWWQLLDDGLLNELVTQCLTNNYDINIAIANVREAKALASIATADRWPELDLTGERAKQKLPTREVTNQDNRRSTNNEIGVNAQWEFDLFSRLKNQFKAAQFNYEARRAALQSIYTLMAAETVRAYIELRSAQSQRQVAEKNIDNQRQFLELTQRLEQGGRRTQVDVARAQTQLQLTKARIPTLDAVINMAINRLSVLTANTPDTLKQSLLKPKPLPNLPVTIALGETRSLLLRRGDVRQAEYELAQATALYNVNVASLYPQLSLSGRLGFRASASSDFGDDDTALSLFGVNLSWSLFNRGKIRADISAADANIDARLAQFEKRLLEALEEVDNAITNFSKEQQRQASLLLATKASVQATKYATERYEAGLDSYLDVLDAQRSQLDSQNQLAVSEGNVFLQLVSVYQALGGGWEIVSPH